MENLNPALQSKAPGLQPRLKSLITGPRSETSCLHELFELQADVRPDAVALVAGEKLISYADLERASNQLAHYLRRHGVGPGTFVGLYLERSERPIIAILACLKAGAAYVPIDPVHPEERVRYIVSEAEIPLILTESRLAAKAAQAFSGEIVELDTDAAIVAREPASRLTREETGLSPEDLCYVIYTSGTTGRPKGVMTEHRNAHDFVRAFNTVCDTTPDDRIYQGFSLGFDGSVEEIWMAFSNGASLVVGHKNTPKFGNDVARLLAEQGVTYFSTVPTMLSTMTEDVPSLRQLVVSGEVCPPELVARWAKSGRTMLNVYGPTEATVNTTAFVCRPDAPVTIGGPIEGYTVHILDEAMRPLPNGEQGELYVGGPGLARGYLKRPDLTAEKFVTATLVDGAAPVRLYRTGDLARINALGHVEFFGRIDGQVKIRGYRVELAEIESVLREHPRVVAAAVKLFDRDGIQELAAYAVTDGEAEPLDRNEVLSLLRVRLPDYMVPGYLDVLAELPTLASGKVDRPRLPAPVAPLVRDLGDIVEPATPLEAELAAVWAAVFRVEKVSVEQNFFTDLGGHSLLAAQMATLFRSRSETDLAVRDVYHHSTVRALAVELESRSSLHAPSAPAEAAAPRVSPLTRRISAAAQAVSLYLLYGFWATPLIGVVMLVIAVRQGHLGLWDGIGIGLVLTLGWWPCMLALSIASKWVLIGRYREGATPLWGLGYFRWWLAGRLQGLSGAGLLAGTPLLPVYYRAMGAKVGKRCSLETALCGAWDLVSIGDDTSLGPDTQLLGYRVEKGRLRFGRIDIGRGCFVGVHSAFGLGVTMHDGARLGDQSLLADGCVIAAGESRLGSPAQIAEVPVPEQATHEAKPMPTALFAALQMLVSYAITVAMAVPALAYTVLVVGLYFTDRPKLAATALFLSVPTMVVTYCFWIAGVKAVLLKRVAPGVYRQHTWMHLRKWAADGLMRASRALMLPLFTTLYLPPWLRLLGAKIGARAELSAVWSFVPELLEIGEESFFADGCILGGKRLAGGLLEVKPVCIGRRTFIGNSAIVPAGTVFGDSCLLGVLSAPPQQRPVPNGTDWLGSPPFPLPNRQKVRSFAESTTFRPTRQLYLQRAMVDGLRVVIPGYIGLLLTYAGVWAIYGGFQTLGVAATLALGPLLGFALAVVAMLLVVALKRGVMGKFEPVVVPLWSAYVWLNEMVNGVYESVMAPALAPLLGTPFAAPFLRMIGCRIGKEVYLETSLFSEFDLVKIGDRAELNAGAIIQTHLFEDRIMKSSYLEVREGASVGNMAVVLYDATMEPGAWLGPLSLLMKGETLAADSRWHGIPTVRI